MDSIRKLRIKHEDGTYSNSIPIGASSDDIFMTSGGTLTDSMSDVEEAIIALDKTNDTQGESIDELVKSVSSNTIAIQNQKDVNEKQEIKMENFEKALAQEKVYVFDNVHAMKNANNLKAGMYCITKGYYTPNDGGKGEYLIRTKTDTLTDDGGSVHELSNNLVAELIIKDNINVKQFGAYGDGKHDDTNAINNTISYAKMHNKILYSSSGNTYLISQPLLINDCNIDFNYSTIKTNNQIDIIQINSKNYYGSIKNLTIDCNGVATSGINIIKGLKKYFNNINMINVANDGFKYSEGYEITFENTHITGTPSSINSVGLNILSGDSVFNNIVIIDCYKAIINKGKNFYKQIHAWIKTKALVIGSIFADVTDGNFIGNQIYPDTYHYCFYGNSNSSPYIELSDSFFYWNKQYVMTEDVMTNNLPYIYYNGNSSPSITSNHINMINCEINGQMYHNQKTQLTNENKFYGVNINSIIYNVDYETNLILTNVNANLTPSVNKTKRITAECNQIDFIASLDTSELSSDRSINIGTIPYIQQPPESINTYCIYGNNEYNVSGLLYMYISTNGNIQVVIPSSITGTIYIKIHIIYYSSKL